MDICCIDNDMFYRYQECIDELEPIRAYGQFFNGKIDAPDEDKIQLAKNCEVVFFGTTYLANEIIEKLPKVKILQFMGTGVANYVDIDFCKRRNIAVLNVEDYGSNSVAEYAVALMFASIRNIPTADARMKKEIWTSDGLEGGEIEGAIVGVLGTGNIGSKVAKKLVSLGAQRVLAFDAYKNHELIDKYGIEYMSMEEIFEVCDIISVHLKYTNDTYKIVSGKMIKKMKKNAYLINTARAELVDYEALEEALRTKSIKGAAIDVFYEEPLSDYSMCKMENIIATSHIGFFSRRAKRNLLKNAVASAISEIEKQNRCL
jgi:phosphoglycerate dehydrogenase-like enzyme